MRWAQLRPDWEQLTTVNAVATPPRTESAPPAGTASARRNEARMGGGGLRLADAFDVVSSLPVLLEARVRLLTLTDSPANSSADLAEVIESDCGLTIAVMRAANNGGGPPGRCDGVRGAVEALTPEGVKLIATSVETYDLLAPTATSQREERFRRHAVAVRDAAERVADLVRVKSRDELAVAALLHDIGRLVIAELHTDFDPTLDPKLTPEDRLRIERRELGIDHALVGAVLARRWGVPPQVAGAIERHHAPDADGLAAIVRLADLVAHQGTGDPVAPESLVQAGEALGVDEDRIRTLVYEFPYGSGARRREQEPCPLSVREVDALRGLAEGKVYKQIAQELSLSVSTIRTHLHNVYRKVGAVDRAQAVLIAREKGWI
jgi:putative nucleotidyltransferase with HDIG domain